MNPPAPPSRGRLTLTPSDMENTPTPTPATVHGWSTRETWRFALEHAPAWDVPALYRAHGRDVHRTADALRESAVATLVGLTSSIIIRACLRDWIYRVDFVQIVEHHVEGER